MLHIHRAERADVLITALADVVSFPLDDPLATEIVSVPTRGVERWLAQQLATTLGASAGRSDGVCANVEFPFPSRLLGGAVAAATGVDPLYDPWLPERAVWPLVEMVDQSMAEPWMAPLAAHIGQASNGHRQSRRFESIRHLADLYDRYSLHRPAMLNAWAAGDDVDGNGEHLPAAVSWQAELWRRLRGLIGVPSPAERLTGACSRLRADSGVVDLPTRMSLFGLTRLPASHMEVLTALAEQRHVHLFLLHPSAALWAKVETLTTGGAPIVRRRDDVTAALPANPLLASWGHDAREMQLVVAGAGDRLGTDVRAVAEDATTLLHRIQADVRADRAPSGAPFPGRTERHARLESHDRSLQVHSCHGLARQVEVVRDAILHLLADDPTLEARDVIVMCPDIETFAPLIHATFGAGAPVDDDDFTGAPTMPNLRVRLADRSLRQTNPLLGVVAEILELGSARVTAAQVLDLAGREPVRRRFGFGDDDLSRVEDWVTATGVRWGLDAEHRAPFKLEWLATNTWSAGLDRVLLGVTMAEEGQPLVGRTLPLDDVGSADIDLAGRLAELLDRLKATLDDLRGPNTVP
ncbi:MAG TPA: exodeoxyribonuclease V subunit gamma, partial [Acidimicrobiales bacterium]